MISRKCPWGVEYLPQDEDFAWINFVYVAASYRKSGIGKKLYLFVQQHCQEKGISEIMLDVMEDNPNSQRFHEKLGFKSLMKIYSMKVLPKQ